MAERFRKLPGMDPIMDSALIVCRQRRRSGQRWPPQGLGQQAVVGAAADLDHRLAPAEGAGHRGRDRSRAPDRPPAADSRRLHRDLLVRRRLGQPRHRADRVQCGILDGVPEAAGAGAVRLRGQRHRHLGEDADRLDRGELPQPPGPRLLLRRRPRSGQRLCRRAARGRALPAYAPPDLPAPAHHPDHGPRRHRLRDRVAQHRGTVRGGGGRPAAALRADRAGVRADVEGRDPRAVRRHAPQVLRRRRGRRPAAAHRDAGARDAPAGAVQRRTR